MRRVPGLLLSLCLPTAAHPKSGHSGSVHRLARLFLAFGTLLLFALSAQAQVVTEFSAGISSGIGTITAGPDGNLWFTETNLSDVNRIGRITPAGVVTEFSAGISSGAFPSYITAGPDGNLWFTYSNVSRIGRITPAGVITEFSTGISANAYPHGITAGPDGNVWFTEWFGNRIGRITPAGVVTEFSVGISANANPHNITTGPDGNLWFTEQGVNRIGRITPAGVVTEFSTGITAIVNQANVITAGPDGNLWFTISNLSDVNRIGRITPAGVVTEFTAGISSGTNLLGITAGPDGNLWFTEQAGQIGRITPTGVVTEFNAGISAYAYPQSIVAGPDGNLWFTEAARRIGRITPDGGGSAGGTTPAIPAIPSGLSPGSTSSPGPTQSSSTVTASWNDSSGATSYLGGITDIAAGSDVVTINTGGTSTTATLSPGKQYRWYVYACSSSGCSSSSAFYYFQTPATLPAGYISQGGLTWMLPVPLAPGQSMSTYAQATALCAATINGQTGWRLPTQPELSALFASGAVSGQLGWTGLGVWSSTSGGQSGTHYAVVLNNSGIMAIWISDAAGALVSCVLQTPAAASTTPAIPTSLSPGSTSSPGPTQSSSTVIVSWNASSGATSYLGGITDIAAGSDVVTINTSGTSTAATLSPGKQYRWYVYACNSSGCSSTSAFYYFQTPTTVTATVLGTPVLSSPSNGATASGTSVTLRWNQVDRAGAYSVGLRDQSAGFLATIPLVTGTSYTANVIQGHSYVWDVASCTSAGGGDNNLNCPNRASNWSFTVQAAATALATPTGATPGSISSPGSTLPSSTVTLSWGRVSGATYYDLRVTDMVTGTLVANPTINNGASYTTTLTGGRQYQWNVAAYNATGRSTYTTLLYFQTPTDAITTGSHPPYPVIFIHGINSDSTTWSNFRDNLVSPNVTYGGSLTVSNGRVVNTPDNVRTLGRVDFTNHTTGIPLAVDPVIRSGAFYALDFSDNKNLTFGQQGWELAKIIEKVREVNIVVPFNAPKVQTS